MERGGVGEQGWIVAERRQRGRRKSLGGKERKVGRRKEEERVHETPTKDACPLLLSVQARGDSCTSS